MKLIKAPVIAIMTGLILVACAQPATDEKPNQAVSATPVVGSSNYPTFNFADQNLADCVRQSVGIFDDTTPSGAQLAGVFELDCRSDGVQSLVGLEDFTQLQTLILNHNDITDLSPLQSLTNLIELELAQNTQLASLAGLENKANLEVLNLANTQVTDLSTIAQSTALLDLDLFGTGINNLLPLAGFTKLEKLSLAFSSTIDLNGLQTLVRLSYLNLSYAEQLKSLEALAGLQQLTWLDISHTAVSTIEPLNSHVGLQTLDIGHTNVADLTPLTGFVELTDFSAQSAALSNISVAQGWLALQTFSATQNAITDVSPLAQLPNLIVVYVQFNPVTDCTVLDELKVEGVAVKCSEAN